MSTPTTAQVSAPWAQQTDLPTTATAPPEPWSWEQVLTVASETLYALSGRQWRGVGASRVRYQPGHGASPERAPLPGWVPWDAEWPVGHTIPGPAWWGRETQVVVDLPSSPVVTVDHVTIDGTELDPPTYRCSPGGQLERCDGHPWPLDGTLVVEFTHGRPPPQSGVLAVVALAQEIALDLGGSESAMPAKLRSLTREGVTAALKDDTAAEDLDRWRTGIPAVDLFLTATNPHRATRSARCWVPGRPRPQRITS